MSKTFIDESGGYRPGWEVKNLPKRQLGPPFLCRCCQGCPPPRVKGKGVISPADQAAENHGRKKGAGSPVSFSASPDSSPPADPRRPDITPGPARQLAAPGPQRAVRREGPRQLRRSLRGGLAGSPRVLPSNEPPGPASPFTCRAELRRREQSGRRAAPRVVPLPFPGAALASRAAERTGPRRLGSGRRQVPAWPLITAADSGRFLALAAAALLLLAVVAADEPLNSPDPTSPAGSQTPEPVANSEPPTASKSEASGESESASPGEQAATGVAPVSFAQADRSHTEEINGDLLHSDASNFGSLSLDLLPGDTQSGPAMEEPAHSQESQESLDHEGDSEESLTSPGM
ncbi:uncharacterized protein M6D78_007864 [Vipera latastei]